MSGSKYIYNNEAFGISAMASVLKHMENTSYSKTMLILPFVTHKETLDYLKLQRSDVKSIEQLIAKKANLITNFNKRFLNLLPISLNSLHILHEMKVILIKDQQIKFNKSSQFNESDIKLGARVKDVVKASKKIANLLQKDESELYLQLRVLL
ncbi:three component ABC system middle component [Paenibacillus sp. Soil787]|uniref:three component ABC system middle component n=1 Tax=Paenibacillus sp. Soil787 TaxID=1736411 RepID=UPI0007032CBE|nr:three component ABC system middle component [Paenibacillus sp. Soil787]KRF18652.1 hypothetical protein ASG93_11485 [Paenibacillus sp. Soil787]